ncbi:MAG: GerMN domain-containing protein [Armatimonadota bacterium]|nr:GerMN domain-containing protein [Armatimonadota bacterium]MDR7451186.1 GerMN domain-containing protein [Armatimonadota bacterium]MDR7467209.1 GerMN domain-containing protein [Armatimonadota bacterium]MDR7494863.1 GerMN domain-containing protein [Armatimonadota bacterium]MDR7504563.1 GerMN domain-containing protein [Armatimonadota bacterium]
MTSRSAGILLLALLAASGCRPSAPAEVSVFFTRAEGNAFVVAEVRRAVPRGSPETLLRAAFEELLRGPTAEEQRDGLISAIPPGTTLRRLRIVDGVAEVDFSREFEAGGGSASMLGRFWQVVYTGTQFPQARRVQILIDGERREAMGGEGVVIEEPVGRPPTPPRF